MRVAGGSWRSECDCYQDVINDFTWHILVKRGLIVTLRFAVEYLSYVQLICIEPP